MKDDAAEARLRQKNAQKAKEAADQLFPGENWINAASIKLEQKGADFEIPNCVDNIKVAKSRITSSKNDARTLAKEIRQAKVLADRGASVFILPKIKTADGREISGPDALVNGSLFEFKTVTGSIKRIETRFRESREQGQNVYIRVMNPNITKSDVIRKMYNVVNDTKYTGGFKGNMIFSVKNGNFETLYYLRIKDLKK